MEHKELTEKIIGCAYRVYNKMGFGFLESIYEKCLAIELEKAGIRAEFQKPVCVYYDNQIVGEFVADILVDELIIVELKSVRRIVKAHYLVSTKKDIGLLLNFGERKVEIKRKVRELPDL